MSENDQTRHHAGDTAFIQALAELLNRNELTEISVKREYGENDRLTVSLSKHGKQVLVQNAAAPVQALPAPALPAAQPAAAAAAPAGAGDPASHPGAVTSPMVGTAYLSAEPGSAPFVSIGQTVAEGDTLMIVEAMKTMNHIPAPRAGTVRRVLVEDGTPVEFGTPLMIVE
ncbi:acetyl-CoA carboxylase biotin carboxyl carrier protein [Paracoccus sp. (in: a-proteobacteria)]|uniref:acetyl-CoA carboxylase biotin carboxyl carrier protein n=1 Tax=Paracoccus sp. TaxID=267 RepID=UPI0026DF7957|nr:acetyl-CoA carboxylase biotin carboxyl carrier protein [Paracoccus sp. (in: a-proteobacteria)]MDO5369790.1 acetyl-CoA carboxylase biotin carboxyl carrier protein [Paracoccus sp. (in: a-proteobacteria)]